METLKTKSQMIERIAELNKRVAELNRGLNFATADNINLICNMLELRKLIVNFVKAKTKDQKKIYEHRLSVIANMSNEEWWEYMNRE